MVAEKLRRKEDHHATRQMVRPRVNLTSDRLAYGYGAVIEDIEFNGSRDLRPEHRKKFLDAVDNFDGVSSWLALDGQTTARVLLNPAGHLVIFHAV
jgi:hypothetical protein